MLRLTALGNAEYPLSAVAAGIDDYYLGLGEAPGVWAGRWSAELGLEGVVDAASLRALVQGQDPRTWADLLAGHRDRKVAVWDATISAPKSVSLLWAFGSPEVATTVMHAHVDAVGVAMRFIEERAAFARRQERGVRVRVGTGGFAVASFVHRTSREGDPQIHSHCLIPNVVRRDDGAYVAFDASPLHEWAKAAGTIYQAELQRVLTARLGVAWGPERNGTREMVGFSPAQLRAFSKRSVAIEAELAKAGATWESPAARMAADERAALKTRPAKDRSLTPALLAERWEGEAAEAGITAGEAERVVCVRGGPPAPMSWEQVAAALIDPDTGLCAHAPRFTEPDVVARVAGMSAGRWTTIEIEQITARFLGSEHAVRLAPTGAGVCRRLPEWSTPAQLRLERCVLDRLAALAHAPDRGVEAAIVERVLAGLSGLGADQADAVRALCAVGGSLRSIAAPAGFGKTACLQAAVRAADASARPVVAVAATAKATGELTDAGVPAVTIARLRLELAERPLAPGTVVIVDEVSQVGTRDAAMLTASVLACRGVLWCVGDARQGRSVPPGGLAAELDALAAAGEIAAAGLDVNRRQRDPADQQALALLRTGRPAESQAVRAEHGWEHEEATPEATRTALAERVVADIAAHGAHRVVALAVSHADCEDLADRIRALLRDAGAIGGAGVWGPGWTGPRCYQPGDRILLHARAALGPTRVANGTTAMVLDTSPHGLKVITDRGEQIVLPTRFVAGARPDGSPNVSHAWARTIDGAQGGTWEKVHVLGSTALDLTHGYVAQSRSREPAQTWNSRPVTDDDHGGVLADRRTASEVVLGALKREHPVGFAVHDDPAAFERSLAAERAEHLAVLAEAPPHPALRLATAQEHLTSAVAERKRAVEGLAYATGLRDSQGLRTALSPSGRAERRAADADVERATARLAEANAGLADARAALRDAEAARDGFETLAQAQGWRRDRVAEIDALIERRWADAVLTAVRQHDPLAFGADRLRDAADYFTNELSRLERSLPPDRSVEVAYARRDLADVEARHRDATREHAAAARELQAARGVGLRARDRRERATAGLRDATETLNRFGRYLGERKERLAAVDEAQAERAWAVENIDPQRRVLSAASRELTIAIQRLRPDARQVEVSQQHGAKRVHEQTLEHDQGADVGL